MKNLRKLAPVILTAGGLILISGTAFSQTPEERIEALENKIRILERKLEIQSEEVTKQAGELKKVAPAKDAIIAKTNNRSISFETADGGFKFKPRGRLHLDTAFHDEDVQDLGDGTRFRRARLGFEGTVFKNFNYLFEYDFAGVGGVDDGTRGIRDAFVTYTGFKPVNITVGNFKEPFSLEQLTSTNSTSFVERSLADTFAPARHIGAQVNTSGEWWSAAAGVFGETPEGDVTLEGDEGWDFTGRLTAVPFNQPERILHIGAAGRYHVPNDSANALRFRARPEANVTDVRLVDTGVLTGALTTVNDFQSYGLEAAGVYGPFSVQGEYIKTSVDRDAGSDLDFDSWYVFGSWFLTGESRPYKVSTGVFDRINPKGIVGKGGYGAWELLARYSGIDLNDGVFTGGAQKNLTLGINWYLTSNIRLQGNYIKVLEVDRPGNIADNDEPDIFILRTAIDY